MTQKRKKPTPADHLIDSLMDDLKDVGESSHSSQNFEVDASAREEFRADLNLEMSADDNSVASADPNDVLATAVGISPAAGSSVNSPMNSPASSSSSDVPTSESSASHDPEKTFALPKKTSELKSQLSAQATQPLATRSTASEVPVEPPPVKVSYGSKRSSASGASNSSVEHHLKQADNLALAQTRILDLEKQLDAVRLENDQLTSSMEVARSRLEEATKKINQFEKSRAEAKEQAAIENSIHRENLQARDYQIDRLKQKIEELEGRLNMDMKKIRVRERELENRLELSKAEKNALVRSKDDHILELKRKTEQMTSELSEANAKAQELMQKIESNQDQFARTVRALRLALSNLEAHEETSSINYTTIKKAE